MKKYWREILLATIVVFLVIPLSIAFSVSFRFICTDTSNEWIGFWGGYLGAILGALITLYVLFQTLQEGKKAQRREERINFCNYIAEISGRICTEANKIAIFVQRAVKNNPQPIMDNIYNALLAYNEVSGLFQSCTSMLLAKINNPNYAKIEMLMDSIYELQILVAKINIKGEIYTQEELEELLNDCKKVSLLLEEMRDCVADFIESNETI
jgi:K+ transporter